MLPLSSASGCVPKAWLSSCVSLCTWWGFSFCHQWPPKCHPAPSSRHLHSLGDRSSLWHLFLVNVQSLPCYFCYKNASRASCSLKAVACLSLVCQSAGYGNVVGLAVWTRSSKKLALRSHWLPLPAPISAGALIGRIRLAASLRVFVFGTSAGLGKNTFVNLFLPHLMKWATLILLATHHSPLPGKIDTRLHCETLQIPKMRRGTVAPPVWRRPSCVSAPTAVAIPQPPSPSLSVKRPSTGVSPHITGCPLPACPREWNPPLRFIRVLWRVSGLMASLSDKR